MARPPLALNLGFVFPLQLFVMQTLGLLGRMFLIQLPALPDDGQPGGLDNPLGARALYIFKDGADTGYRVHGSPEWWTIGQAMSSGCVRMINQDVIDLFNRVHGKTPIVVG